MTHTLSYDINLPGNQYSFEHVETLYNQALQSTHSILAAAIANGQDAETTALAASLISCARTYDIQQTYHLLDTPYNKTVIRNPDNPPDFTSPHLIGQPWADDPSAPLEPGEDWNTFRRKVNIDIAYPVKNNLPVCPYLNFGISGRGVIGRYGPNHAIDNGILRIMSNTDGKQTLHALGIIRQDNNKAALCGGFVNFVHSADGHYHYNRSDMIANQTAEFVEELVSGSVELTPSYAAGLDQDIKDAIAQRAAAEAHALSADETQSIADAIITHRKMAQIATEDPQFLDNISHAFSNAYPCYAGPVLNSDRNTNQAWMETRLSWILLDKPGWTQMKGDNKFNYELIAGDDARSVLWHEITPELMQNANGSHDAFFSYMLSGYLLTQKHDDPQILANVKDQASKLIHFFASPS